MKILILGAGGVGGYFGGRLAHSGADVTFLVREKRQQQLQTNGLTIESPLGNLNIPVKTVTGQTVANDADLILLTCKAYDLDSALDAIAPAIGPNTAILPLLNGVSHLARLNERFGKARVWCGTARISAALTDDGVVKHFNGWASITFGQQDNAQTPKVLAFRDAMVKAGIDGQIAPDIVRDLWMKLVQLGTMAVLTSLLRANIGEINRAPEGRSLFMTVLQTHADVAAREGYPPDGKFLQSLREIFSDPASMYEASLARDMEKGGPIEADHIIGFLLDRVRAHGLPDTIHLLSYTGAKAYEQRRAAGRLTG